VDCKSLGTGDKALVYLGRHVYQGVIRGMDVVACNDTEVSFVYRNAKTARMERRSVSGAHFLWLVLEHVLPKGVRRARNFGFLHPNCKRLIALLRLLLNLTPGRGVVQGAGAHPVHLLRGGDGDRKNAASVGVCWDSTASCRHQRRSGHVGTTTLGTYREFSAHKLRSRLVPDRGILGHLTTKSGNRCRIGTLEPAHSHPILQ